MLPARPRPVRVQRWSARRVGLLLLVVPVVLGNHDTNITRLQIVQLDCERPEPLWLEAQSVPSASLVPCVRELAGWRVAGANARNGWSQITLDHDRAGGCAATWHDRFPGGCVTSRLRSTIDPDGRFATEAPVVLGFVPRQTLRQLLEVRSGGRLHLDPATPDSS